MGVIGGICFSEGPAARLRALLDCQAHRAAGAAAITHDGPGFALGMCNPHDGIWASFAGPDGPAGPTPRRRSAPSLRSGGVHVVVDGIVLDGPALREELADRGVFVARPTCAALLAGAYRAWGLGFMEHLEGEFSCAVWDDERRRLVLARDPFGSRPIHYSEERGEVVFSSEIKGVLAAGVTSGVDLQSLSTLLSLNGVPAPGTLFSTIKKVEPGTLRVFESEPRSSRSHCYWSPIPEIDAAISAEQAAEELEAQLQQAVRRRMLRPETYCLLSGGMDSSCVVSLATEAGGRPVHAVSIGFEDASYNELDDARAMAEHVGAEHHYEICKPHALPELVEKVVRHQDEPFFDTSAFPTHDAARLASSVTDLVLTGDGPDQLHGGSPHHVFAVETGHFNDAPGWLDPLRRRALSAGQQLLRPLLDRLDPRPSLAAKVHRKLHRLAQSPIRSFFDIEAYFPEIVKRHVCSPELWRHHEQSHPYALPEQWFAECGDADDVCKVLHADVRLFLPDDLMIKVDRMFRVFGVETLSPFLDRGVARAFLKLPGRLRVREEAGEVITKGTLRRVTDPRLPQRLREKKKQGFGVPLDRWLREEHGDFLREMLLDSRSLSRGIFRPEVVRRMVETFLAGRNDYFYANEFAMIGMASLEVWHRAYID
jgi:asparagine synthase (glutamine-hydrolysing)